MELTPEDRQRIEDEERKRAAEEKYRTEVRAKLQSEHGAAVQGPSRLPWILGICAVFLIGGAVLLTTYRSDSKNSDRSTGAQSGVSTAPTMKTRYVPVNQKIATGQIIIKANGYVQYRIAITPEMIEPTVTGSFNASGGSGNDIQAIIADEMNYANWINGHQAHVFWGTEGKQTTGKFEVKLQPGTYYLVFSNRFSVITDKQLFLEVDLNYKKAETYY